MIDANRLKAVTFVETHPRCVCGESSQDHFVVSKLAGTLLQRAQQRITYPTPALFAFDIDGDVYDVVVSRARIEGIERTPAYDCTGFSAATMTG